MALTKLITVEPVLFLQMVGDTLTYVIYQNLFIDKICRTELNYGKELCDRYASSTDNSSEASNRWPFSMRTKVQESSARFVLYNSLVENSLPIILVLVLGVWSDAKRKRKPLLLFALFGKFCHSVGLLLNAYFMDWSPMLLLLTSSLPYSIGGAKVVFHMAVYSYIADSSIARHRTWRLSIAEAIFNFGAWIGLALGAHLFQEFGYICAFGTSVIFHCSAIVYTMFAVPEISDFKNKEATPRYRDSAKVDRRNLKLVRAKYGNNLTIVPSNYCSDSDLSDCTSEYYNRGYVTDKIESDPLLFRTPRVHGNALKPKKCLINSGTNRYTAMVQYAYGTFRPVFRPRKNHSRLCVVLMGIVMLLYGVSGNGEASLTYLFTRYKFQWREQEFSYWRIFDSVMTVLGLGILMPLFTTVLKLSDTQTGAIAAVARFSAVSCIAFAPIPIYLFAGSALDIFGVLMPIVARSLASKCVLTNERGRVFAFLGCIEAVARLVSVPLYSVVYTVTLTTLPSTIYYMSMSMYFTIIAIFSSLFIAKKMNWIEYESETRNTCTQTLVKIIADGTHRACVRRNTIP